MRILKNKYSISVLYFLTLTFGIPTWAQDSGYYGSSKIKTSSSHNKVYGFEIAVQDAYIRHQLLLNQNMLSKEIKLTPMSFSLVRRYSLNDYFYTSSSVRYIRSDFGYDPRLETAQFVQQLGYNIQSWKIDNSTIHPFVNYGVYQSIFKDTYLLTNGFNEKIQVNESGALAEVGINFISRNFGMISTLKAGKNLQPQDKYISSKQSVDLTQSKDPLDASQSTYYSFGFGILF